MKQKSCVRFICTGLISFPLTSSGWSHMFSQSIGACILFGISSSKLWIEFHETIVGSTKSVSQGHNDFRLIITKESSISTEKDLAILPVNAQHISIYQILPSIYQFYVMCIRKHDKIFIKANLTFFIELNNTNQHFEQFGSQKKNYSDY